MLAKSLAKESGATFINVKVSSLTDKWFGESNKLVAGLFSLAKKLQPSIIFIDEIDSFMRERSRNDHEVTGMMYVLSLRCPALFGELTISTPQESRIHDVRIRSSTISDLTGLPLLDRSLWDGLATNNDTRILVLGATNRPNDIDSAILRRMPKRFSIKLPDSIQRRNILNLVRLGHCCESSAGR